jgi:hypothetical protein
LPCAGIFDTLRKHSFSAMKRIAVFLGVTLIGCMGCPTAHPSLKMPPVLVAKNGEPLRSRDGSYPLLLASMESGQVTEITPGNVIRWGEPTTRRADEKDYWIVWVAYTAKTKFGAFQTEAEAYVIHGAVKKWVYVSSGETVP